MYPVALFIKTKYILIKIKRLNYKSHDFDDLIFQTFLIIDLYSVNAQRFYVRVLIS